MSDKKKSPTHAIYQVREAGEKSYWTKIGAAWLHDDTKGANLAFDCIPLSGKVVLREISDKEDSNTGGQQ